MQHSRVKMLAARTDVAWEIARLTSGVWREIRAHNASQTIPVGISARQVHLTQDAVATRQHWLDKMSAG